MGTQTDRLEILLDVSGEGKAVVSLSRIGNSAEGVDKKSRGMAEGLTLGRIAMAATAAGAYKLVSGIIKTTAEFEKLNASLKTVTGSQENATRAMDMIKALATQTPFSVSQLTESFIKLKALGLDPSEEALISYGNTAAAMGKDLNQMIEAVADASTGEFERLKEFGIKARQQGDEVSLTFQGITTTIGNNSQAIQKYLMDIGNNQFAGAMTQQMDTLNGAFSNLGDSVDLLFDAIGRSGLGNAVKESTQELSAMVTVIAQNIEQMGFLEGAAVGLAQALLGDASAASDALKPMTETQRAVSSLGFSMRETQKRADEFAGFIERLEKANVPPTVIEPYRIALQQALDTITALKAAQDDLTNPKGSDEGNKPSQRAGLGKDFKKLQEDMLREQEELIAHYEAQRLIVDEWYADKENQSNEKNQLLEQIESEHLNRMLALGVNYYQQEAQLAESAAQRKTRSFLGGMISMTAGLAQHSKTLFEINKIATLSQIAMDTPAAISGAYKWGASIGGPIAGAAAATVAALAQAAQFRAAQATKFGGSGTGTTPSSAGTIPVVNDQPVPTGASNLQTNVTGNSGGSTTFNLIGNPGDTYTHEQLQAMLEGLRDAIANGDQIIIPQGSRQAQELQAA